MKTRRTIAMLLAVGVFLAAGGAAQAAPVLTQGGYDAQTSSGDMPATAFSSPLGSHTYSQAHNTAWTRSGNHQVAAGVIAAPVGGGPAAATSPANISWHNSGMNGTQTQALGGTMDANTQHTLSFDGAIRDQGQFGGGQNVVNNLGPYSLLAILEGSADGELARIDVAPLLASVDTWHPFSLTWDSTGATEGPAGRRHPRARDDGDAWFGLHRPEWISAPQMAPNSRLRRPTTHKRGTARPSVSRRRFMCARRRPGSTPGRGGHRSSWTSTQFGLRVPFRGTRLNDSLQARKDWSGPR